MTTRHNAHQLAAVTAMAYPRAERDTAATPPLECCHADTCLPDYWSVRRQDGGKPFIFEYKAPASTWRANAEHDARAAIIRAGLRPWVHIETVEA